MLKVTEYGCGCMSERGSDEQLATMRVGGGALYQTLFRLTTIYATGPKLLLAI
jgi:hypothetical protein